MSKCELCEKKEAKKLLKFPKDYLLVCDECFHMTKAKRAAWEER